MKVLLAGATGAIGRPLSLALQANGYDVIGLTRDPAKASQLSATGVQPVVADVMDRTALLHALRDVRADAVIHQLTALAKPPARHRDMAQTNLLRTTGTEHLLAAAKSVGATRFVTQSMMFGYGYRDHGDEPLTEASPYGRADGGPCDPHSAAMLTNERLVCGSDRVAGISLRYGLFYGGALDLATQIRARKVPVPRHSNRTLAWIHLEDAANATVAALEQGAAGAAYNIVDDEALSWSRKITDLAGALGGPTPYRLPGWMVRVAAPYAAAMLLDTSLRVSNAKARSELGWAPTYPTHQQGIAAVAAVASR